MILTLIGRLHPLLVHFPIALVFVALAFAVVARLRGAELGRSVAPLLTIAAVSAVLASTAGWFYAGEQGYFGGAAVLLDRHRWLGIGATVALVVSAAIANRSRRPEGLLTISLVVVAVALIGLTAHLGGTMVFGEDHFVLRPALPKRVQPSINTPREVSVVDLGSEDASYATVRRVFRRSCLRCHDAQKRKGGLRLDEKNFAMAGGDTGAAIVPGDRAKSLAFVRVSLPRSDEDYMPSKGAPLSAAEIELLGAWIDAGADWPE